MPPKANDISEQRKENPHVAGGIAGAELLYSIFVRQDVQKISATAATFNGSQNEKHCC